MSYLEDIDKQLQDYYQKEYNQEEDTPHGKQAKYLSWNDYFMKKYNSEGQRADYKNLMLSLVGEVKRYAPGPKKQKLSAVLPAGPAPDEDTDGGQPVEMLLSLVQFPLDVKGYIRGATNSRQILENMSKFILTGNKTEMYPIEVAPDLLGCSSQQVVIILTCFWESPPGPLGKGAKGPLGGARVPRALERGPSDHSGEQRSPEPRKGDQGAIRGGKGPSEA